MVDPSRPIGSFVVARASLVAVIAAFVAAAFHGLPVAAHSASRELEQVHESLVASSAEQDDDAMNKPNTTLHRLALAAGCAAMLNTTGCGGSDDSPPGPVALYANDFGASVTLARAGDGVAPRTRIATRSGAPTTSATAFSMTAVRSRISPS